ncbi:replication protein [Pectobacterium carotovorum]|uniref:replication protein n=1 Tax=Pectobacterium carotovorum TaxID=554 RepID=UPI000D73B351|nr:replication protein [Pectobacterium carotovorum]PXB01154.1 phage replication protein [Pectobacterium carotovorum subsp. carotovorum]
MNTAKVIKFPGPEPGQEKRVADLEDGYTRTANELLEAVMLSGLTQHQLLIVIAVWRKTYGYNKKMDWIGNEQFEQLTGMAATKCSTAKNELIRMGVLVQQGRQVGMNKAVSEWKTKFNGFGKTFTDSVKKSFPESVKSDLPKRSNTKDNITKDNKDSITPIVPTGDVCEKPTEPDEEEPVEQPVSQAIKTVFSHWQAEHNHPTSKLDPKRRKRINARLEEGFSVAELCKAISGAKYDPWLMGKNPSNRRYDGIETILRDAAQVEKLRDLDDNEHAKAIATGKYSATTARNLDTLQRWAGGGDNGAPF